MLMFQFEDICNKYGLEVRRSKWDNEAECWYKNHLICNFSHFLAYMTKDLHLAGNEYDKFICTDYEFTCYEIPEVFELKLQEMLKKYKQLETEIKVNFINKDFAND